jgi:integrase
VVAHGTVGRQRSADTAIAQVLVRYWHRKGSALASREVTKAALGYWSDFFGEDAVAEVTPTRQREFMAWLHRQRTPPLSTGYVKRIMGVGKAALNDAYREGELESVPFILPGEDAPPQDLVLSLADSAAIWAAAGHEHERMMLALLYGTLARPEAALALRREYVDFERRLLAQNPPGRRQTRKYRPVVPVVDFLLPWLEAAPPGPLVAWRGKPIRSFKTAWRGIRRRAGLPAEVVPKTIRHTMATELRAASVPEAEIQGILGHRAYSGRTEVYAKYRPDFLGQAAAAVDGYMTRLRASGVLIDPATPG